MILGVAAQFSQGLPGFFGTWAEAILHYLAAEVAHETIFRARVTEIIVRPGVTGSLRARLPEATSYCDAQGLIGTVLIALAGEPFTILELMAR